MDDKQRLSGRDGGYGAKYWATPNVDRTLQHLTPLNDEFQDFITRYAGRDLDASGARSLYPQHDHYCHADRLLNREAELKMHLRASFNNGVTRDELERA